MIAVICGKSGKTTTAVNLAGALAQRPVTRRSRRTRRVLGLDADVQGSWLEWSIQRTRPPLYEVREYTTRPLSMADLSDMLADVDDVVVDLPAGTGRPGRAADARTRIIRGAILSALQSHNGVVVGVVTPSPWELWASDDLVEVIDQAQLQDGVAAGARTRAALLLNRAGLTRRGGPGRPDRIPRMVRATHTRLAHAPLPVLSTVIHTREHYVQAPALGLTVTEHAPTSPAASEIRALAAELITMAGEKQ